MCDVYIPRVKMQHKKLPLTLYLDWKKLSRNIARLISTISSWLLGGYPYRVFSYKSLFTLYWEQNGFDYILEVFCVIDLDEQLRLFLHDEATFLKPFAKFRPLIN